jgi:tetratricopeptide (TPR) repeat protein
MKKTISKKVWIYSILLGLMGAVPLTSQPAEAAVSKGEGSMAKRSAKVYLQSRQYDKALQQLLIATEGRPDDLEVHYEIGNIYSRKELYDEMNKHFNAVENAPKNKKWMNRIDTARETLWRQHYNLGVRALDTQKMDFAIEQFMTAIKVNPKDADAYEGMAIAYLQSDRAEQGIKAYRNAIERNPKKAQSYYNLSVALTNQGTLESQKDALGLLETGHELAPKDLQILQQMALLYNRQGNNEAAGKAAEKALAVDPKNPTVLNIAAQIFLTAEDFEKSAAILEKVLEVNPDDQNASFNLAIAYNKMGKPDKAVALYKKSVDANPTDGDAWFQLGDVYTKLERFDESVTAFQKVIELQPANYRAWGALSRAYAQQSNGVTGKKAEEFVKKATEAFQMYEALQKQQSDDQ